MSQVDLTASELLVVAPPYVFLGLALAAVRQWVLRRDVPGRELAVTFSVLAGVLLLGDVLPLSSMPGPVRDVLSRIVLVGLVLFPWLLLRFASAFERPPAWIRWSSTGLVGGTLLATLLLPPIDGSWSSTPLWLTAYVLAVIVEWAFLSAIVAARLWRAGAGLPRVARLRMRTLSAGSAVLAAGLVGALFPGADADWVWAGANVLALCSGALFLVGFTPPAWLVRTWRGESESVQRLLVGLVAETDGGQVVGTLLPRLLDLVGARGAALVSDGGELLATAGALTAELGSADLDAPGRPLAGGVEQLSADHVRVGLDGGALHVWTGPYAPYFGRAELGLLASFGALLQLSLQRNASHAREREAAQALEEAQSLAGIGSWRWTLGAPVPVWSKQMLKLYGLRPDHPLTGGLFMSLVHRDDRAAVEVDVARAAAGEDVVMDFRIVRAGGDVHWLQSQLHPERDGEGVVVGIFGTCQDVTERRSLERELEHQARHDPLTGLPNRRKLVEQLAASTRGPGAPPGTAVLFLDVDRFKIVNDSLGHEVGDQVLLAVAERLTSAVRSGDVVGRFGGDEFVVVSAVADEDDALALAERLREATSPPILVGDTELVVTLSTGIALCLDGTSPAGALVRDADAAMYAAKRAGGDRAELFASAIRDAAVGRLAVEVDLRRALAEGQLRVHYQPVCDTRTGALVGAEALVRWQHPTRGLLGPAEFVGVAEETGLIAAVGRHVLHEACTQLRTWQDAHPRLRRMWMSVNLSALQVFGSGLVDEVVAALDTSGIAPDCLTLEITESVLMTDVEPALVVLDELRALGVHLSVDDFGTGYSSLSYLTRLPVSSLKVDKSFLARLDSDPHALAVVQAVAALADSLGLSIVAEGVETAEQLETVRGLGCGMAQGYLLGRPVPPGEWARWLSAPGRRVPGPRLAEVARVAAG